MRRLFLTVSLLGVFVVGQGCGESSTTVSKDTGPSVDLADAAEEPDLPVFPDVAGEDAAEVALDTGLDGDDSDWCPNCVDLEGLDLTPNDFGKLCTGPGDCDSGQCLPHMGDYRCTVYCVDECPGPEGEYACEPLTQGTDPQFACISKFPWLCYPCMASKDCLASGSRCVMALSGEGAFCSSGCAEGDNCPAGYECSELKSTEGDIAKVCLPAQGEACQCSTAAKAANAATTCLVTNEIGTCVGTKSCGPDGWSDCTGANPQLELCFNQLDDDCNGIVDDPLICNQCSCGDGVCQAQCGEAFVGGEAPDTQKSCAADCASCGNGSCDPGEGPSICPQDCCGSCGDGVCGAGVCGEDETVCPQDCPGSCGDAVCDPNENAVSCPQDCPKGIVGNGTCDPEEYHSTVPSECGPGCGDCICQHDEFWGTCPMDCGYCGDGYCFDNCPAMYAAETLLSCKIDCCIPDCTGRVCGDDGCGGSCGECPTQHVCKSDGQCVCVPMCEGFQCGDDGCGGSCGNCGVGTKCVDGICQTGCDLDSQCAWDEECLDGYCANNLPDDAQLIDVGPLVLLPLAATPLLTARVFEAELTPNQGAAFEIAAEFGWGSAEVNPKQSPASWTWTTASFHKDDEGWDYYQASFTPPGPGEYGFTFRFSLNGTPWVYADGDGLDNGFDPALAGRISVTPPPAITQVSPKHPSVLGGDNILVTGTGFIADGITLLVDGLAVVPVSVSADQILFKAPAHDAGAVEVKVVNADGQWAASPASLNYVRRFTPTVDGNLSEWDARLRVGTNTLVSNWDQTKNSLDSLCLSFDGNKVYIGIKGKCEAQNYIVGYLDVDFGASSGVAQMAWLSDNAGDGDLDDALSSILDVTVSGFGADWGFGSKGMATFLEGSDLGNSKFVGWRAMGTPYNLPWWQGTVACSASGCEASFSLGTIFPLGVPAQGTTLGLFARITDRYGDSFGISNQGLPEYYDAGNPHLIGAVAQTLLVP